MAKMIHYQNKLKNRQLQKKVEELNNLIKKYKKLLKSANNQKHNKLKNKKIKNKNLFHRVKKIINQ
jgi:uncharacterized protein YlxW (UPF0749 family)